MTLIYDEELDEYTENEYEAFIRKLNEEQNEYDYLFA